MSNRDLGHASARGVVWNLIQNLVGRLLSLIVFAILGRLLEPASFGAIAVALSVIVLAELVMNQGFGDFVAQRAALTPQDLDTAFWINAGIGIVLAAGLALAASPIAAAFGAPEAGTVLQWLSLSLVFRAGSAVPTALLVRNMAFRTLSLRSLIGAVAGGATGVICALSGAGMYSLVAQLLVGEAVGTAVLWGATDWRPGLRVTLANLKKLTSFGLPLFAATLLSFVSRKLDAIVIAGALGLTLLGTYSMAQRVFQIANQIINKSADAVAFSALARLGTEADQRRAAFYRVLELTAVVCFPIYVGLSIVAAEFIVLVFGARWVESAPVLTIFALAGVPVSLSFLHAAALKAAGRTRSFLIIHVVLALAYLPLLLLLVDRGPSAAAVANLVSCCVVVPVEVWLVREALDLRVSSYLKALIGPMLATVVMSIVTLLVGWACAPLPVVASLLVQVVAGALAFGLSLRLLARGTYVRCRDRLRSALRSRQRPPP